MIDKKKIAYRAVAYSTVGLALVGSTLLMSMSANHNVVDTKSSVKLDSNELVKKNIINANLPKITDAVDFTVRSNPTNGFSELVTPDGKLTFVLITKNGTNELQGNVGGSNSGIACIDGEGNVLGTWYLPSGVPALNLNYTTNIVFGQTSDGKIDPNTLFVLCGISNLAAAINTVYTSYAKSSFGSSPRNGPTIKIFKLKVSPQTDGSVAFENSFAKNNSFYNFAYPSDGTNGYAGFTKNGNVYDFQSLDSMVSMEDPGNDSLNYVSGIKFNTISRGSDPAWADGQTFQANNNMTIGAFGSYLTYLTYGQNFAYHYDLTNTYANHDEFIMTTSFVNVDQNIGGLYSATVNNEGSRNGSEDGLNSYVNDESNWPIPFGYQWLLASIANQAANGKTGANDVQYSFIDAAGNKQDVLWGNNSLALKQPIINFLNNKIFPTEKISVKNGVINDTGGWNYSLLQSLKVSGRFGANWGSTTGYIIYTPAKAEEGTTPQFTEQNINEYRYYYIGETAVRSYYDGYSSIEKNTSSYVFTNVLATDKLNPDGSISYLIGAANAKNTYIFSQNTTQSPVIVSPFSNLLSNPFVSMFCYDWNSISNDDKQNALIQPVDDQLKNPDVKFGLLRNYYGDPQADPVDASLFAKTFTNWNLVFLGGPSKDGIKKMDATFNVDPAWTDLNRSIIYKISQRFLAGKIDDGLDLGFRLTYLRHEMSFVVHPFNGFVYFTAGTSIEWQGDFSLWDVKALNSNTTLYHNYDGGNTGTNDSKYVGNNYLTKESSNAPMWSLPKQAVWAIKEINQQPFGNNGGTILAFVTSNGVYTVAGNKGNMYEGSINNFFADSGTNKSTFWNSIRPNLLGAIQYNAFGNPDTKAYGPALVNTVIMNNNMLYVQTPTPLLYSVQDNGDYLIPDVSKEVQSQTPDDLKSTPAVKPLISVKDSAINATAIDGAKSIPQDTTVNNVASTDLNTLFTNWLGLSSNVLPTGCNVVLNYKKLQSVVFPANTDNTAAEIVIPVTYGGSSIVYFAPILNGQNSYQPFYVLNGLTSSAFATILVVLKPEGDIQAELENRKLTPNDVYREYGGDQPVKTVIDDANSIFVDDKLTKEYVTAHQDYFGGTFDYWVKPGISPTGGIELQLRYKIPSIGITEYTSSNSMICTSVNYNNGNINYGQLVPFVTFRGYQAPLPQPKNGTWIIVGVVVAVLAAVTVALGLGIGLPMRKQHKINILNSKITNRRIDKLSTAISASFKKVIETTATINKNVDQLSSRVHRSLAPGHQPTAIPPKAPGAPTKPAAAPSAPGAPKPPMAPKAPTPPSAPTKPAA